LIVKEKSAQKTQKFARNSARAAAGSPDKHLNEEEKPFWSTVLAKLSNEEGFHNFHGPDWSVTTVSVKTGSGRRGDAARQGGKDDKRGTYMVESRMRVPSDRLQFYSEERKT
jgi:hypothetical protein